MGDWKMCIDSRRFGAARVLARSLARLGRLRLVVRHAMALNYRRNSNAGQPVRVRTLADRRVATATVLHEGEQRSRLPLAAAHPIIHLESAP